MINIVASFTKKTIITVSRVIVTASATAAAKAQFAYSSYLKRAILVFEAGVFFLPVFLKDAFNIGDSTSSSVGKNKTDGVNLQDNLTRIVNFDRKPIDTVGIGETLNTTVSFNRSFTDNTLIGDFYQDQVQFNRSPVDGVGFGDYIDYFQIIKSITDTVSATDDVNGALVGDDQIAFITKVREDGVHLTDSLNNTLTKPLQNNFQVSATVKSDVEKSLADSFNLSDELNNTVVKGLFDQFNIVDTITFVNIFNRAPVDTAQFSDNIDSFIVGKGIPNTINLSQLISIELQKSLQDSFILSDSVSTTNNFWRLPSDPANFSEFKYFELTKSHSDVLQFSDSIFLETNYNKFITDNLTVTDDINGANVGDDQLLHVFKATSNGTLLTDNLTRSTNKAPSSSVGIATSGVANFQNYAADYFSADYVGGSRAFT